MRMPVLKIALPVVASVALGSAAIAEVRVGSGGAHVVGGGAHVVTGGAHGSGVGFRVNNGHFRGGHFGRGFYGRRNGGAYWWAGYGWGPTDVFDSGADVFNAGADVFNGHYDDGGYWGAGYGWGPISDVGYGEPYYDHGYNNHYYDQHYNNQYYNDAYYDDRNYPAAAVKAVHDIEQQKVQIICRTERLPWRHGSYSVHVCYGNGRAL